VHVATVLLNPEDEENHEGETDAGARSDQLEKASLRGLEERTTAMLLDQNDNIKHAQPFSEWWGFGGNRWTSGRYGGKVRAPILSS
jgi:hypothetical protein